MIKKMILALLVLLVSSGIACADFSGNYQYKKKGSFGDLTVKELGNGKAQFKFDNSAGSNLGELEFETAIDSRGRAHYKSDEYDGCELDIKLSGRTATIKQVSGSCKAGMRVALFCFDENRTFGWFVINHHKRRQVHAKETSQLHPVRESSHLKTASDRAYSCIRSVR